MTHAALGLHDPDVNLGGIRLINATRASAGITFPTTYDARETFVTPGQSVWGDIRSSYNKTYSPFRTLSDLESSDLSSAGGGATFFSISTGLPPLVPWQCRE